MTRTPRYTVKPHGNKYAVLYPDGRIRCVVDDEAFAMNICYDNNQDLFFATPVTATSRGKATRVRCLETGVSYPSIAEAARANGVSSDRLKTGLRKGTEVFGKHYVGIW